MDIFIAPQFEEVYRHHPLILVDAGARGGLKKNWQSARRHLRTIGFEPDADEYQRLTSTRTGDDSGDLVLGVALHNRRGPIDLHVSRDRGLSSFFEPNRAFLDAFPDSARFDTVDRARVEADTLDDCLPAHGIQRVDFLKVDTQGSELYILQGAAQTLSGSAIGVEVEAEFSPIYTGQPLFADVDGYLRKFDFQLFDLRPCYWKRTAGRDLGGPYGQIVWADALYIKTVQALDAMTAPLIPEARRAKLLKAITVSLLYGYVDYALEIAGLLDAGDRLIVDAQLRASGVPVRPLPPFPGKRRVAALFRRLARAFTDPDGSWSVGEGETGNTR